MKTSLSFHGTYSEVVGWVREWREQLDLNVVAEYFFPAYRAVQVEDWPDADADRISLHIYPVDLVVRSGLDFVDKNPNGFSIVVGQESAQGLRGSLVGATTDNREAMKVWRKLRRDVRDSLNSGAWRVSTINGARSRDESHLYTSGAKRLQDQGVPSLGASDWIVFELD